MKVLVVEDRAENILTAMEFFSSKGIEPVIAGNVEEALERLHKEIFLAAIIDVEIPRSPGCKPERLGPQLGKVAEELGVPHVYLTGGYYHHGRPQAKVFLDEVSLEKGHGEGVPEKTNPQAWEKAWEILQSFGNLKENYEARVRYRKYTGKIYKERR